MGGSGIDPFGPTPNAYLTKEGEVVPVKGGCLPAGSEAPMSDGPPSGLRFIAAASRVMVEAGVELPSPPFTAPYNPELEPFQHYLTHLSGQALGAVNRLYREASDLISAVERERDEAQLEVERLGRELEALRAKEVGDVGL